MMISTKWFPRVTIFYVTCSSSIYLGQATDATRSLKAPQLFLLHPFLKDLKTFPGQREI